MHHQSNPSAAALRPALPWILFLSGVMLLPALGAGAISIMEIQSEAYPSGFSMHAGEAVSISGVVTATFFEGYVVSEGPGPWQSILVYSWTEAPQIGDAVSLNGWVYEYYQMTEIVNVWGFEHISSGNAVEPTVVSLADASQEQYESVLLTVENVTVAALLNYGEWAVTGGGEDFLLCNDQNDYMYFPKVGDTLDSLTGILSYTYGAFKLEPRATYDISGPPIPHYALHGRIVTMNADREVFGNGYVEILGDRIMALHGARPKHIPVVETGGLIFPGLIDAHNHPFYTGLGPIPFGQLYEHRDEWRAEPIYGDFGDQLDSILDYGGSDAQTLNWLKMAEIRGLVAGTTAIQGSNCNGDYYAAYAHQGIILDNVERYPALVYHDTFPLWGDPAWFWPMAGEENWERFIVHIAEGTNEAALAEFHLWQDIGMLDERTTLIHGVALGPPEWDAMAAAGASLVWSPVSNLTLYGATANIPAALAAGVNVALAPDWSESGSVNILDEMKAAQAHNEAAWGGVITPQQLAEFVTCNAALATGAGRISGQVTPGYRANLTVIPGGVKQPYRALLKATPAKVKLTVVDGEPRCGNPDVMEKFPFLGPLEYVMVGGVEKALNIQEEAHAIPESDKPYAEIIVELEEAYAASSPMVCDFVGLE